MPVARMANIDAIQRFIDEREESVPMGFCSTTYRCCWYTQQSCLGETVARLRLHRNEWEWNGKKLVVSIVLNFSAIPAARPGVGIINYDLLRSKRLRSTDYLTVMSASDNYIYIFHLMKFSDDFATG